MRIAISGGTGFVGGRVSERLREAGHDVVVLSRRTGFDLAAPDPGALRAALNGVEAVVHCAGINREIGDQTYDAVHVRGTQALLEAARAAGVGHIGLVSFLRARPDGTSAYHRSKWAAEAIVREGGIPFTVLKAGVIHGRGDHLLDHVSRALRTFPVFALVGMRDQPVRPVAVDDVARILAAAATGDRRLHNGTFAVLGPEELTLREVIERIAATIGRGALIVPLPVVVHLVLALAWEAVMRVPLASVAQVRILSETLVEASPPADPPPADLIPTTPFSREVIAAGLPEFKRFGRRDLRWCRA